MLIKRSTRWEFLLLSGWASNPSVMPSTRFSTGNDTDLLRCKNRKENIKVSYLYLEWLWMLPLWCHFCLVLFFSLFIICPRLYWSVDIWTAGTLGRAPWMMAVGPLYHGKHSRLSKILVNIWKVVNQCVRISVVTCLTQHTKYWTDKLLWYVQSSICVLSVDSQERMSLSP